MRKLFVFVLTLFVLNGKAQNAFFDAQYITRWYWMPEGPAKGRKADTVLAKMIRYGSLTDIRDSTKNMFVYRVYRKAYEYYIDSLVRRFTRDEIVAAALQKPTSGLTALLNEYVHQLDIREGYLRRADSLLRVVERELRDGDVAGHVYAIGPVPSDSNWWVQGSPVPGMLADYHTRIRGHADTAAELAGVHDALKQEATTLLGALRHALRTDSTQCAADTSALRSEIYHAVLFQRAHYDLFFTSVPATGPDAGLLQSFNSKLGRNRSSIVSLISARTELDDPTVPYPTLMLLSSSQQADAAAQYPSENARSLTAQSFPSQAQVIDALAIYIARRVKQEAVLYFMEQQAKLMKYDRLAQELFPETWKVLRGEENFAVPRFGAKWRNAISADLVTLPGHIVASSYVKARVRDTLLYNYLSDAVTFGTMVTQRYNFIEILQNLHNDPAKLRSSWIRIGVDALHIMSQELYDTSGKAFWLSPQRFLRMDSSQLYTLYDLVRIKYHNRVCPELQTRFNSPLALRGKTTQAMRFYTELLTLLQHFSNLQSNPVKGPDGQVQKDGFWDTQRAFLDFLLNHQQMVKLNPRERAALELCKRGLSTYDHLSSKNYIAATGEVIGMVSSLIGRKSSLLIDIDTARLSLLRSHPLTSGLYTQLLSANSGFSKLLQVSAIRDSVWLLPDTAHVSIAFLQGRFMLGASDVTMLGLSAARNYTKANYLVLLDSVNNGFIREIRSSYDSVLRNFRSLRGDLRQLSDEVRSVVTEARQGQVLYRDMKALTDQALKMATLYAKKEDSRYFKWLTDFSELMTQVANTHNSKELANVIESYALPAGSYRVKRASTTSIDLNAYPGLFLGLEQLSGNRYYKGTWGLTAPIGVSFSWGLGRAFRAGSDELKDGYIARTGRLRARKQTNFSIDLSIIDIAAVLAYRLENGEDKGLPNDVRWSQVFAPGLNVRYSLRNTPLCLGAGVQYTPKLRYSSLTQESRDALRVHIGIAFDLPLLNLYRSRY